jgi:hypothetical protein
VIVEGFVDLGGSMQAGQNVGQYVLEYHNRTIMY